MNWVGGSRHRLVRKNDTKKQREFFEKRKLQQKLQHVGISAPGTSSGSMDLVNLFVVNQIATKKKTKDPPKVAVFGSCKRGSKRERHETMVLPMSPCSPSQLSLAESQSQYSVLGVRKRMDVIPQGFKCQKLSQVLESSFSDNSASDYRPPITDHLSPFSSTSSSSSGQAGIFPLQHSLQQRSKGQAQPLPQCSPPPWDSSGLDQTKFPPFSLPRGMTRNKPWICDSDLFPYQRETPKAAQILFGSPEKNKTEVREHDREDVRFFFNQPVDKEPILNFTFNQPETEQQFTEEVFRGFFNEEYQKEGLSKLKIYLRDETSIRSATSQTVPDSECGVEPFNCTYTDLSGPEHKTGPINSREPLPNYSCSEGYLSSDSTDEEECCQLCLNTQHCAYSPGFNRASQGEPNQRHPEPSHYTPPIKAKKNLGEVHKVLENEVFPDKACGSNGGSTAQCLSPYCLTQTESCGLCKCKKTLSETRDVGTQTVITVEMCDASTQCKNGAKDTEFSLYFPPVDVSMFHPATRWQAKTAAEPNTHQPSSANWSGGNSMPRTNKPKDYSQSGKENRGHSGEAGRQENGPLMKDRSDKVRQAVKSGTTVNRSSEESETLQEIANILLLFQQRNVGCKEGTE